MPSMKKVTVRYVGTADIKELNAASWRSLGVEDQEMTRWVHGELQRDVTLQPGAVEYLRNSSDFAVTEE